MTLIIFIILAIFLYVALSFPAMRYIAREIPGVLDEPYQISLFMSWPIGLLFVGRPKPSCIGNAWHSVYCKLWPIETENKEE